jgi:[ribosomal protein S5]-alanine N-acetyltransferase
LNHNGSSILENSSMLLRPFIAKDADAMYHNWCTDSEVTRFLTWFPHQNLDETRSILQSWLHSYRRPDFYHWAIELKEISQPIGSIGVVNVNENNEMAELGYCIGRDWWGKGIVVSALKLIIPYLFNTVGFERLQATHFKENIASGRVMQKAGMKHEGTLRHFNKTKEGDFADCEIYAILKGDF